MLLICGESMHFTCRWAALQGKESLTKLGTSFSKFRFSETLEGIYASLKYLAQASAYSPQEQGGTTAVSLTHKIIHLVSHQLQEVLKLLGRQERLPSSNYVFIDPNTGLFSVKKKTHLVFLHLHSKPNDSNMEWRRGDEKSQNKNFLKSLTEHFARYLAKE